MQGAILWFSSATVIALFPYLRLFCYRPYCRFSCPLSLSEYVSEFVYLFICFYQVNFPTSATFNTNSRLVTNCCDSPHFFSLHWATFFLVSVISYFFYLVLFYIKKLEVFGKVHKQCVLNAFVGASNDQFDVAKFSKSNHCNAIVILLRFTAMQWILSPFC